MVGGVVPILRVYMGEKHYQQNYQYGRIWYQESKDCPTGNYVKAENGPPCTKDVAQVCKHEGG